MAPLMTASADGRVATRTVPPSGWEADVCARAVAGDDTALREIYDQYASCTRDDTLLVRSFETWVHTDDLRRAAGRPGMAPEVPHLLLMSDLARRILPLALAVTGREHDGKTARLVLTGDGGGDWLVPMGSSGAAEQPDVTVTADVVDWCRLVGDRVAPDALRVEVDGDEKLGRDLVAAAPALATL